MEIKINNPNREMLVWKDMYVYGKYFDKQNNQYQDDEVVIYISPPALFKEIDFSSLEGIFIQEHYIPGYGKSLATFTSCMTVYRKDMKEFEQNNKGKFIPFEK